MLGNCIERKSEHIDTVASIVGVELTKAVRERRNTKMRVWGESLACSTALLLECLVPINETCGCPREMALLQGYFHDSLLLRTAGFVGVIETLLEGEGLGRNSKEIYRTIPGNIGRCYC